MLKLIIGDKNYSSWSFRPWIAMKVAGIPFEEEMIHLYEDNTTHEIRQFNPSGTVPVLHHDGFMIWESLAILEYLAETFPDARLWPEDKRARAHARSAANEMHAGFGALRDECPMNFRRFNPPKARSEATMRNVARIAGLWNEALDRFGGAGPFLYGRFSIADAMFAPVVSRFVSYGIEVDARSAGYMNAVQALPAYKEWAEAAARETRVIAGSEVA